MIAPLYARYIPPEPSSQSHLHHSPPRVLENDQHNVKKRKRSISEQDTQPNHGVISTLLAGTGKHVRFSEEPILERKTESETRHKEQKISKKDDGSSGKSRSSKLNQYADRGASNGVRVAQSSGTHHTSEENAAKRKEKHTGGTSSKVQSVAPSVTEQWNKNSDHSDIKEKSPVPGDNQYGTKIASRKPKKRKKKKRQRKSTDAGSLSSLDEAEAAESDVAEVIPVEHWDHEKRQDRKPYERDSKIDSTRKKQKHKQRTEQNQGEDGSQSPIDDALDEKYSGIRAKFKTSLEAKEKLRPLSDAAEDIEAQGDVENESQEIHGKQDSIAMLTTRY